MIDEMTINGIDLSVYNARLLDYAVSGTVVTNNLSTVDTLLRFPALFSTDLGTRVLTISITFSPGSAESDNKGMNIKEKLSTATDNITRFEADIIGKTVEITLPDGYIYTAIVTALPAPTFDSSGEHDVTYTFSGIRHGADVIQTITSPGKVFCKSTTKSPVKFIVGISTATVALTICGITVNNISANSELIIDGINGIVTLDGVNKLIDTDLVDFPILSPGYNVISCSDSSATIKVVYTPVYV